MFSVLPSNASFEHIPSCDDHHVHQHAWDVHAPGIQGAVRNDLLDLDDHLEQRRVAYML